MSNQKLRIEYDGIGTREEIDAIERRLKALPSVTIHELGINEVDLTYDRNELDRNQIEREIEQVGGSIRDIRRDQ